MERRSAEFGDGQWTKVAAGVAGRTADDCRSAWKRHLAAARGLWSTDESDKLSGIIQPDKNVRIYGFKSQSRAPFSGDLSKEGKIL